MPEGDTIHRAAARLHAALAGRRLTRLEAPRLARPMPPAGTAVARVEARGKHLLVHFDDGHVLHTHLRMDGAWRVRATGTARGPSSRVRVLLGDEEVQAVCRDAPVVELLDAAALDRHPTLRRLGPDLCDADVDLDEVVARVATHTVAGQPLADALLDQRIAAGIGNVYASEVAFLAGRHPATPVDAVDVATRHAVWATAARLLRANLDGPRRTTVPDAPDGSLWVYERHGRPCRRCGTPVAVGRLGRHARSAWWCPSCQPDPRAGHDYARIPHDR